MNVISSRKLSAAADVRRVEMLFDRMPSSIVVAVIGIFLCFFILAGETKLDLLKGWAAYMLSVFVVRVCIWYMFGRAENRSEQIQRWEWLFAAGAFLTGLGWGVLFGPLYPPTHSDAQMFIALTVLIVVFTGSIFFALSNIAFWLFILPALIPAIFHYASVSGREDQWPMAVAACCMAILVLVGRALYSSATDTLERSVETENLLAEQQAIFESSPMGIAVIDEKHVIKCNARLGELMGRRIQELTMSCMDDHFASDAETARFFKESASAFARGHLAQGMYCLRRADGSHFWAELSGRKMKGGATHGVWMVADVTMRVANERRSQQGERRTRSDMPAPRRKSDKRHGSGRIVR